MGSCWVGHGWGIVELGRPWYPEPQRRLEAWEMFPSGVGTGQVQETKYHTVLTTETGRF